MTKPLRLLVAASGSGGHILPAVYVTQAISTLIPTEVLFIGSGRPLEEKLIDRRGYERRVVQIVGLKRRGIRGLFEFITLFPRALFQTVRIFSEFRPDIVYGAGGYTSVLPVLVAAFKGIPTWIHEADALPGHANTFLARFVDRISIAFQSASFGRPEKTVFTGHPIRPDLRSVPLEWPEGTRPKKLLVLGGSQGSRSIDHAVLGISETLKELGFSVWHQCRPEGEAELKTGFSKAGIDANVSPFIERMDEALAWADLVIGRAGAGGVCEVAQVGIPAIFIPLPLEGVASHQRKNAEEIAQSGKAIVLDDGEGLRERLAAVLRSISAPVQYRMMRLRPPPIDYSDAARKIARGCLALVERTSVSDDSSMPTTPVVVDQGSIP